MWLSFISKIKSILGLVEPISANNVKSLSKEFQQSECKCEQSTFKFMGNNHSPKERVITPLIYNTIDIVECEMTNSYFLKPELPVIQNSDGQLNMLFNSYTPSIKKIVSLVKKENLDDNLVDVTNHKTWENRLWHWADVNNIDNITLPRNKDALIELKQLSLDIGLITTQVKLPKEIGKLKNLEQLEIITNNYDDINPLIKLPKEICNLINLKWLLLCNTGLTDLPKEIVNLTNLEYLNLSNNKIPEIQKEIGDLVSLTHLNLANNQLAEFPHEVIRLINLSSLDCAGNNINVITNKIVNLEKLLYLDIASNQLTSLPENIFSMSSLEYLDVGNNQISKLSKGSTPFTTHNLKHLYLNGNKLTNLPIEICSLNKLTELRVSCNRLTSIPPEIGRLSNLTCFDVCWNLLNSLPKEIGKLKALVTFHIYENKLTSLPEEINHLNKKIKYLDLSEQNTLSKKYSEDFKCGAGYNGREYMGL
jgi:Leucine-rich repeat (LRR) protein